MTEFLDDFSAHYNASFMSVPAYKTVIVIVTAYCLIKVNNKIFKSIPSSIDYAALILLGLCDLFVPMLPDSALMVWLYYFPYQLFTLYISLNGLYRLKKNPSSIKETPFLLHYKKILFCTLVFSFLIVMEDTIVIFNFDSYTNLLVKINNRSVTEDILSIIYAVFTIYHLSRMLKSSDSEPLPVLIDNEVFGFSDPGLLISVENDHFYRFSKAYSLTIREQDILSNLLENKDNQEISDSLFISIGTVKTHVHNIYQKTNVTKRHQLIEIYQEFSKKPA
jgi:DNA-binding CsgD family transcriptional regulator